MTAPSATPSDLFDALIPALADMRALHAPDGRTLALLRGVARREVEARFTGDDGEPRPFGPFGPLAFPYFRMGAVDSLALFDIDELIIFAFYHANRGRYRRVADIGANIGLHSIVAARCGFEVRCFEPDPHHFERLRTNLAANGATAVAPTNAAVAETEGTLEFVRVLGNTTGSHLAGAKPDPYGELERFPVRTLPFGPILEWADLVKMDVEGFEKALLTGTGRAPWETTDAIVEIGNADNAAAVFAHFRGLGVGLFAQKLGWAPVTELAGMPTSYREGSLFVSCKPQVPWGI